MQNDVIIAKANALLALMQEKRNLETGLEFAKLVLESITEDATEINFENILDFRVLDVVGLGNIKMENWFKPHPYLGGHFSAFQMFESSNQKLEAKFFHLNDRVIKRIIAAGVQLTPNWEDDAALTRNGEWKVGIDFFLSEGSESLLMVLSLEGNLRVVEFSHRLTSTQLGILEKIRGAGDLDEHAAIHSSLWSALGMREVNKDFYEGIATFFEELLQKLINSGHDAEDAKLFSSRLLGRLLFVWFLRRKGFIDEELGYFDPSNKSSTDYYQDSLKPLFFATLNTPVKERGENSDSVTPYLNGGLFEIHENDWYYQTIVFPEDYFTRLYDHFNRFNFTTDESSPEYEQVAIDPEMLGRVFESLLATQVAETGASARKANGAFYTPREVVAYICKETLRQYLYAKLDNPILNSGVDRLLDSSDADVARAHSNFIRDLWGKENRKQVVTQVQNALDQLKILDPACGSGAFPLGMVQLLTRIMERLDSRFDPFKTKLSIIKNSIYGVDIEPMAIEIAKLRTWLSLVVDEADSINVVPLPNLDFKYVCANSLISLAPKYDGLPLGLDTAIEDKLTEIRDEYFATSSIGRKKKLRDSYKNLTAATLDDFSYDRLIQLKSFNPFEYSEPAIFFDSSQMFGVANFDIVIGNPPYIGEKGNKSIFDKSRNSELFQRFYQGRADILNYFIHLGIDLLKSGGLLGYITTNYYPTSTGGSNLRRDIEMRAKILTLINFNEIKVFESALGQHNMITILQRSTEVPDYYCNQTIAIGKGHLDAGLFGKLIQGEPSVCAQGRLHVSKLFESEQRYIRFISNSGLGPVLDRISNLGEQLGSLVDINQGVITGMNRFTKSLKNKNPHIDKEIGSPIFVFPNGSKDFPHLRPWYKNSDVLKYIISDNLNWQILWLGRGGPEPTTEEMEHLLPFKSILENRDDFRDGSRSWYELNRAREEKLFIGPKIVAPYRCYSNNFAYSEGEFFGASDITFLTLRPNSDLNIFFILGLLNSDLMYAWFYLRGKRKGEMLELLQVPISEVPLLRDKSRENVISELAREIFNTLTSNRSHDVSNLESRLNAEVNHLYGLNQAEVTSLQDFISEHTEIRKSENGSVRAEESE